MRAAGSKSANEDPELFDKIFITGLWNANLTAKNKIIQLGFYYVSVNFHVDFTLRESSPFAFNTKPLFSFFDRAELFSAIDFTYHVACLTSPSEKQATKNVQLVVQHCCKTS